MHSAAAAAATASIRFLNTYDSFSLRGRGFVHDAGSAPDFVRGNVQVRDGADPACAHVVGQNSGGAPGLHQAVRIDARAVAQTEDDDVGHHRIEIDVEFAA